MYEYRCTVVKIVDGDTVDVDIDLGFGVWLNVVKDSWRPVTKLLVEEGHAVAYFGGSKDEVQAKHLVNRSKLIREGIVTQEQVDKVAPKEK